MKRTISLVLALLLLCLNTAYANAPSNAQAKDLMGTWHQSSNLKNPWQIELRADGTGTMSNPQQTVEFKWLLTMLFEDSSPVLEMYVDMGKGEVNHLDSFLYYSGFLISEDNRVFGRGEPDEIIFQSYPGAKPAPKSAFDGVWQLTGGLMTIAEPPMQVILGDEDLVMLGLKLPIYIGIWDGVVATSNQGTPLSKDPAYFDPRLQCFYSGSAIYVAVVGLGMVGILYYTADGIIHAKGVRGPEVGVEVVLTLVKTDLDAVPPSDQSTDLVFPLFPPPPKF